MTDEEWEILKPYAEAVMKANIAYSKIFVDEGITLESIKAKLEYEQAQHNFSQKKREVLYKVKSLQDTLNGEYYA